MFTVLISRMRTCSEVYSARPVIWARDTGSATYHQVFRFTFHQQQNMHKTNNRNYYRTIPIPVVDKTHNYLNSTKTQIQHQANTQQEIKYRKCLDNV